MTSSPEGTVKPKTWYNLNFYSMPKYGMIVQGALSYTALSVNAMYPSLLSISEIRREVILNTLFIETWFGTGLYLYGRKHLETASTGNRIFFSAFGSFTFTMASICLWNSLRNIVPQKLALSAAYGIGSGWALIILACRYCDYVDSEYEF